MPGPSVITDSSACVPPEVAEELGVHVLPITIRTPSGDLLDGGASADGVYEALRRGEPVKSAAPTALDYLSAIEGAGRGGALVITPAIEFTGMHRSASAAADLAEGPVEVLDSRTAAAAQGLVVLAAARAAAEGASPGEVRHVAEDAARRADLVATLGSLERIRHSGRVPALAVDLARRLGVRPVFRLRGGKVERLGVPRSEEAALRRILREWRATNGDPPAVFHAAASDRAEALRDLLGGAALVCEFSPSMGIHTGPGVVGAAWLRPA